MSDTRPTREIMERARQEDIAQTCLQRPDEVPGVGCPGCGEVGWCVCQLWVCHSCDLDFYYDGEDICPWCGSPFVREC